MEGIALDPEVISFITDNFKKDNRLGFLEYLDTTLAQNAVRPIGLMPILFKIYAPPGTLSAYTGDITRYKNSVEMLVKYRSILHLKKFSKIFNQRERLLQIKAHLVQ